MASITIRNLDDDLKRRLRLRAAENSRSMEAEVRDILQKSLGVPSATRNLGQSIHAKFAAVGGIELSPLQRAPNRAVRAPE